MPSPEPYRILVVDDTQKNVQLLGIILKRQNYLINVAYSGPEAIELAQKVFPDLILLDIMMPGMDGYETCERLKKDPKTESIPIIFLTAKSEVDDIIKGFDVGAVDYVTKPFHSTILLSRVRTHLRLRGALRELEAQKDELEKAVMFDGLTKLYNHKFIFEILSKEMSGAKRYDSPLSVVMLDLDHFKQVNDTFGHQVGDEVLVSVASALKETIRESDLAGRYGGEEFLIILPSTDLEAAKVVAEKIRSAIDQLTWNQPGLHITISGGVTTYQNDSTLEFIDRADRLLYQSKHSGRNQVQHEPDLQEGTS